MTSPVDAVLAVVSATLQRSEITRSRPHLLRHMKRWGDDWRRYCAELDCPCPDSLVQLADAMESVFVHVRHEWTTRSPWPRVPHGWSLLTPDDARERRAFLTTLGLGDRTAMVPVFGEDGDLLLLARDGTAHLFTRDDWETEQTLLAPSFDALLVALAELAES